ncbi:four helix bundle protein, partial [Arthrospira sp. O9.13F]
MSSMTFEDLDTWKQARKLVSEVYTLTRQDPLSKDFGLRDQL